MKDKRYLPIQIALILSLLVMLLTSILKGEAVSCVIVIAFSLIGLFIVFFIIAQFITRLRQSIWLLLISSAVIVYTGLLMISLSRYPKLIEQIPWNIGMAALGLAVVGFGWGLFMQTRPKQQSKLENLDEEINELSVKIQGVNNKLSDLEKTANIFLDQSYELGRRLTSKGSKQDKVD